jgi:23S rRNA pseudouridine2457 synthase
MVKNFQYFIVYKPYGYLSQFTKEQEEDLTLKDLYDFPADVYPVGRLDKDSEGLILLTSDHTINQKILNPSKLIYKTYWVQVEGIPDESKMNFLRNGVHVKIQKKLYLTAKAEVRLLLNTDSIPPRNPPIRFRKSVPEHWLEIKISEGKNRQIRRMCAAVGLSVLRLMRTAIGNYRLKQLSPGFVQEINRADLKKIFSP